ncbi:MAG TPA: hypothetical protein PLO69_09705 [Gammaproteobacteria bacterium]|nr:hypothetical protein [Gammaproteobacteria bacterium]
MANRFNIRLPGALLVALATALFAGLSPAALAASHDGMSAPAEAVQGHHYSAIFQIDHGGHKFIKKALNSIKNLLEDPRVKGNITVELIANSRGYDVYTKGNGFEKELLELKHRGVIFAQCRNTLHELHIDPKDLYPFITIVPSGVGEITLREAQGWAYIHPSAPPAGGF